MFSVESVILTPKTRFFIKIYSSFTKITERTKMKLGTQLAFRALVLLQKFIRVRDPNIQSSFSKTTGRIKMKFNTSCSVELLIKKC